MMMMMMMMMEVTLMTVERLLLLFQFYFSIWNDYRMYTLYAAHSLQFASLSLLDSSVLIDFNNYRIAASFM